MDLIGDYNMRSLLGIVVPKLMEMEGGRRKIIGDGKLCNSLGGMLFMKVS